MYSALKKKDINGNNVNNGITSKALQSTELRSKASTSKAKLEKGVGPSEHPDIYELSPEKPAVFRLRRPFIGPKTTL